MDGDWGVFGEQGVFDEWAEAEDHACWVAAGVRDVLGVLDFFTLRGGHFGEAERPLVVYAVGC